MKPDFAQYGFRHQENLIMAYIGGSQAHGAKLGATDDTDWYGLYIPPASAEELKLRSAERVARSSEIDGAEGVLYT